MTETLKVTLADVPALIRPPQQDLKGAPLIILWHGYGPPDSEQSLAELLPLDDVPAWKVYPALPLFGERLPEGGMDEIMRRQLSDYVLDLLLPSVAQAVKELPQIVAAVEHQYGAIAANGIGLFGFSAGAATAAHALLDGPTPVRAAVLAGAFPSLGAAVENFESGTRSYRDYLREHYDWFQDEMMTYSWSAASEAARSHFDLGGRAAELAEKALQPAVLFARGEQDEMFQVAEIRALGDKLRSAYETQQAANRVTVNTFSQLAHHLDPTAETEPAVAKDLQLFREAVSAWYRRYLL